MHAAHATAFAREAIIGALFQVRGKKKDREREKDGGEKGEVIVAEEERKKENLQGGRDEETARRCNSPSKTRH